MEEVCVCVIRTSIKQPSPIVRPFVPCSILSCLLSFCPFHFLSSHFLFFSLCFSRSSLFLPPNLTVSLAVLLQAEALAVNNVVQYYFTGQQLQSFPFFGTINKAKTWGSNASRDKFGRQTLRRRASIKSVFENNTALVTLCKEILKKLDMKWWWIWIGWTNEGIEGLNRE